MPRTSLTDEERAARKKRSFAKDQFRQYDPDDAVGRGDARQWRAAAGAAYGGEGFSMADLPANKRSRNADLDVLGLTTMPPNGKDLDRAYRRLAAKVHPDAPGGSTAAFVKLKDAYDRLKERLA